MSNEGDRASVLRTTTVRTKLRGDGSWLQRQDEPEAETQEEEKPWLAEVRARRLNGTPIETSPVSSPVKSTPPPVKSDTESTATQGYLIRGVFTKLENPVSSPSYNSTSKPKIFTKKPSETYKKIAPHTVRNTSENPEGKVSFEEQEKRTEAAINVLKAKAPKQRSYVLSAAKLYEAKDTPSDTSLANNGSSFVAKRVEIVDDDETAVTPAPASTVSLSPAVPPTSTASAPAPTPWTAVNTTVKITDKSAVNEPVNPKATKATTEAVKEEPFPQSVTEKKRLEDEKTNPSDVPGSVNVASTKPQPEAETPLVKLLPPLKTSPAQKSVSSESPAPTSTVTEPLVPVPRSAPTAAAPAPVATVPALTVTELMTKTELELKSEPEPEAEAESAPEDEHEPEPEVQLETEATSEPESVPELQLESKPSAEPSSSIDTLAALSDTLICLNTNSSSAENDKQELAEEEGGPEDSPTPEDSVEQEPAPALRDGEPITGDLLGFSDGPEEPAEPVPPSPGRWSQDLLSGLGSESSPAETSDTLDLLANDVVIVNTEPHSLSMQQQEEEKQTDETAVETQSQEDNTNPWSSQVTITVTESSSADPFDPYPIGTASHNSPSDLLEPVADVSINSRMARPLPLLGGSGIGIPEIKKRIQKEPEPTMDHSQQSWTTTWEISQQTNTEESQEAETEDKAGDQQTVIMFERKSTENDSPWDRWTSPTVYTISTATGEEGEEEEEEEEEDRSAVVEEEQRAPTPEPESKKSFVYVKEYVNASEMSLLSPRDTLNGVDDFASSSISYSYSSPSRYVRVSLSSTCTYCGKQVGNDAKITIEHLNINCHPECFKCDMCSRRMGELLDNMFLHNKKVHCESCYTTVI
ncbi:LOW QUALITY PROTEIN: zinc finger protein 185 [Anableps anableps]